MHRRYQHKAEHCLAFVGTATTFGAVLGMRGRPFGGRGLKFPLSVTVFFNIAASPPPDVGEDKCHTRCNNPIRRVVLFRAVFSHELTDSRFGVFGPDYRAFGDLLLWERR